MDKTTTSILIAFGGSLFLTGSLYLFNSAKNRQLRKTSYLFLFAFWIVIYYGMIVSGLDAKEYIFNSYENTISGITSRTELTEWVETWHETSLEDENKIVKSDFFNRLKESLPDYEIPMLDFFSGARPITDFRVIQESISDDCVDTIAGPINIYCLMQMNNWSEENLVNTRLTINTNYDKKIKEHLNKAREAFNEANKLCEETVPKTKIKTSLSLFTATVQASAGMAFAGYPGLIAALLSSLTDYGVF